MNSHAQALKQALAAQHPQNGKGPATNKKPNGIGGTNGMGRSHNDRRTKMASGNAPTYNL